MLDVDLVSLCVLSVWALTCSLKQSKWIQNINRLIVQVGMVGCLCVKLVACYIENSKPRSNLNHAHRAWFEEIFWKRLQKCRFSHWTALIPPTMTEFEHCYCPRLWEETLRERLRGCSVGDFGPLQNKLFLCSAGRRGDCGLGRGEVSMQMEALRQLNCMGAGRRAREKLL